jgi:hypothetical protein
MIYQKAQGFWCPGTDSTFASELRVFYKVPTTHQWAHHGAMAFWAFYYSNQIVEIMKSCNRVSIPNLI